MNFIKEITVFSIGDANDLKTWSNVPYFFTNNLEEKNIKVNRVNIEENPILNFLYKYSIFILLKIINKNSNHTFFRSRLNYFLTNQKIKKAIKDYSKADALLFLTYSFSAPKQHNKKVILFSDWSYLYYIHTFLKREPVWFEKQALRNKEKHINEADIVLSLFPKSHEFNLQHYKNKHQYYLGNVINANYKLNKAEIISKKTNSHKLLFIGNSKYLQGAIDLINAFKELKTNAELHIIGLTANEIGVNTQHVFYHGYLDKGISVENELYYQLIIESKAIINTNPDWGAFSAMTEAMYYFTPVITSPYEEFTKTYGIDINFGFYVPHNSRNELTQKLEEILSNTDDNYLNLMNNAHEKVKEFTWSSYTDKVLKLINE